MRLDIGDYEQKPTNKIEDFYERMNEIMPSLIRHGCSYGEEGGFLRRVQEGTWAGHVIEHFALELQTLAGMDVGYGRTRETSESGIYNVVFAYLEEECGRYRGACRCSAFSRSSGRQNGRRDKIELEKRGSGTARNTRRRAFRTVDRFDCRRSRIARYSVYTAQ